ncbi:MAG: RDD family protein [Candidatus Caenarcaniphilales bacterium]|nr:RDD family protein [Candidatus Caenarcaniphilales bacterium]
MLRKIATAKDRLTAFYINLVFLLLLTYLVSLALKFFLAFLFHSVDSLSLYINSFLITLVINILITAKAHTDIGKLMLGLEIVNYHGSKATSFLQVFLRTFLSYLSSAVFGLGSLAILFNAERISFHDLCSNTLVVENTHYLRNNIFIQIFHWFFFLGGFMLSLSLAAIIFLSPYPLLNNYLNQTNISSFDASPYVHSDLELKARGLKNKEKFLVPVSNSQIYALLNFKDKFEFFDFELVSDSEKSYISSASLAKLSQSKSNILYYFHFDKQRPWTFEMEPYIIVPSVTVKDFEGHDLHIHNVIFYVSDSKNYIGDNVLSLFDTNFDLDKSQLVLNMFDFDKEIFARELSLESKFTLSQIARNIGESWLQALNESKFKDSITLLGEGLVYELIMDTNYAEIVELTLKSNIEDKALVAFAENFLKNYHVKVKFSKELKNMRKANLTIKLIS